MNGFPKAEPFSKSSAEDGELFALLALDLDIPSAVKTSHHDRQGNTALGVVRERAVR